MASDQDQSEPTQPRPAPGDAGDVEIENGYEAEPVPSEPLPEDDPSFLEPTARALEGEDDELAAVEGESPKRDEQAEAALRDEATGDADSITEEAGDLADDSTRVVNWAREMSAHRVAVELKHIESRVRSIVADRDPKRKRRLSGTRRWQELEEDVLSWRGAGRFDDAALDELERLIARRHYLFRHLTFVTATRPTWNT